MARPKKEGNFINCKLKLEIYERLNKYSEESMIPKTSIVEKALEDYLNQVSPKKGRKKKVE